MRPPIVVGLAMALALAPSTPAASAAQRPTSGLDALVTEAIERSRTLTIGALGVDAARADVDGARARFRPTLALDARYTRADGGRDFEIPVGDLLNPVYGVLNGLVDGSPFPTIENQSTPFLRPREQETRLRVTQLLWSPSASADRTRRERELDVATTALDTDRHRLRLDVALAWYAWREAVRAVEVHEAAAVAVAENERSAERRLAEDLVTPEAVARARAERLSVDEAVAAAEATEQDARARVNFLREAPFDAALPPPGAEPDVEALIAGFDEGRVRRALRVALPARPELVGLTSSVAALDAAADAARGSLRPTVALAIDAGIQGEDYGLGSEDRFVTGSLVVSWPLLDGAAGAEARRVRLDARRLETQRAQIERSYELDIDAAIRGYRVAVEGVARADARAAEAERVFRLVERRRDEGLATALEFLDARSLRTATRLEQASARTRVLSRLAVLRWTAGLPPHIPELPMQAPETGS